MEELTEREKGIVALAIFSLAVKSPRHSLPEYERIVAKLGVREPFEVHAKSWIDYADAREAERLLEEQGWNRK